MNLHGCLHSIPGPVSEVVVVPNVLCHLLVSASGAPLLPVCWPTHVCDLGCWSLGLPGIVVATIGASMLVLVEPDLAHVG